LLAARVEKVARRNNGTPEVDIPELVAERSDELATLRIRAEHRNERFLHDALPEIISQATHNPQVAWEIAQTSAHLGNQPLQRRQVALKGGTVFGVRVREVARPQIIE